MKTISFIKYHFPFIIILLLGIFLRFWHVSQLATFSADQGTDFLEAKKILDGHLTLIGPKLGPFSSFGNIYLGPFYYYLIAFTLFIFRLNPIGPSYLMIFLSIITIIVFYLIGIKFVSQKVALISTAIWSINYSLVEQSKVALNPFPIPLFSSITIFSLFKITINKSDSFIWPLIIGISCGFLFQLHYLTIPFIVISLMVLVVYKKFIKFILGFAAFIFAISPQILFELRHNFFITNQILNRLTKGEGLATTYILKTHLIEASQILFSTFIKFNMYPVILCLIFFGLTLLICQKNKQLRAIVILMAIYIISTVIAASFYPLQLQLHYFASIYLPIVLLLSIIVVFLFENIKNFALRTILVIFIAQIVAIDILNIPFSSKEGYTMPSGWNLKGVELSSEIIAKDVENQKSFNIAATLDGDTRAMPYRYMLSVYGKEPLNIEKYPEADVLYLISRDNTDEIKKYTVWEISSFMPYNIVKIAEIQNGISVFRLTK